MENTEEATKAAATEEKAEDSGETESIKESETTEAPTEDFKEKYFYLAAEMENLRKRLEREKSQVIKFGSENILRDLIHVLDTFELTKNALVHDEDEKIKNIYLGLEMVSKQFADTLKSHGLEKIEALGKTFDPNFHEAIAKEKNEEKDEMTILTEHQAGYVLNGRVLRASKVVVSTKE